MKRRILVLSVIPLVSIMVLFMMLVVSSASADGGYPEGYAADRAQIKDLISRYMFAMDFNDPERFAALFAEDGKLKSPSSRIEPQFGRAAILKAAKERRIKFLPKPDAKEKDKEWIVAPRHFLANFVLKVDGDKAYGNAVYGKYWNPGDDRQPAAVATGHYTDEYVKVNGRWFFSYRTWAGTVPWQNSPEIRTKLTEGASINPTPPPY